MTGVVLDFPGDFFVEVRMSARLGLTLAQQELTGFEQKITSQDTEPASSK